MISLIHSGSNKTIMWLDRNQAEQLRSAIEKVIPCKFATYITAVGLEPSNVYGILRGKRPLSFKTLEQLLSGTNLVAECRVEFLVQMDGDLAQGVLFQRTEDPLSSEIGEESVEVQLTEEDFLSITQGRGGGLRS